MNLENDPFFCACGDAPKPVYSAQNSHTLVREQVKVKEEPAKREDYVRARETEGRPMGNKGAKRSDDGMRRPSMLTGWSGPPRLKIYPGKPPQSKKLFFIEAPTEFKYAEPYDL
jgi:hypothetical protein